MAGETDLGKILCTLEPELHPGHYVFCTTRSLDGLDVNDMLFSFREDEGYTVVLNQHTADKLNLEYTFVAAWITLRVHSSLEAVGLTAAFSTALAEQGISCNVVAAYYHDHLFVKATDAEKAMRILRALSE
jgi:hypothetical protein